MVPFGMSYNPCLTVLLGLAAFLFAGSSTATLTRQLTFMNLVGEDALLRCVVPPNYDNFKTVMWSRGSDKPDRTTLLTRGDHAVAGTDGRYSVYAPYPGDWNLRVSRLMLSDQGSYTCTDSNDTFRTTVTLNMEARPEVQGYPSEVAMVNVATSAEFHVWCNATGIPSPVVRWYFKRNATLPLKDLYRRGENSLKIEKNYGNLTGIFVCNATNKHGYDFVEFHLQVVDTTTAIPTQTINDTVTVTVNMTAIVTTSTRGSTIDKVSTNSTVITDTTTEYSVTTETKLARMSGTSPCHSAQGCFCLNSVAMAVFLVLKYLGA